VFTFDGGAVEGLGPTFEPLYGIIVGVPNVNKLNVGISVGALDGVGGNIPHQHPRPQVW
jgi:hypothetical protein